MYYSKLNCTDTDHNFLDVKKKILGLSKILDFFHCVHIAWRLCVHNGRYSCTRSLPHKSNDTFPVSSVINVCS